MNKAVENSVKGDSERCESFNLPFVSDIFIVIKEKITCIDSKMFLVSKFLRKRNVKQIV